eukprot:2098604-Alexandrium_andersonii.AAC.1
MRIKDASSRARIVEAQSVSEALENQGFNPKGHRFRGSEGFSSAVRCAKYVARARAPQLFPASLLEGAATARGRRVNLSKRVASVARGWEAEGPC